MKKLHPDNLRYILVGLNLVLTAFFVWCGVFAFGFGPTLWALNVAESGWRRITGVEPVKDLAEFTIPKTDRRVEVGRLPATIAESLEPPPPPPPPPAAEEKKEETGDEIIDENGPLTDKWEIASAAIMPIPAMSCIFLSQKAPATGRSRFATTRTSTRFTSPRPTTTTSAAARLRAGPAVNQKCLRLFDEITNPNPVKLDEELAVFLLEIKEAPLAIVYRVDGAEKPYLLKREESDGRTDIMKPEEEEGSKPTGARPGVAKTNPADQGSILHGSKKLGETATTASTAEDVAAKPAGAPPRTPPRSTAEQMRDLKGAIRSAPPSARRKLNEALGGGR